MVLLSEVQKTSKEQMAILNYWKLGEVQVFRTNGDVDSLNIKGI